MKFLGDVAAVLLTWQTTYAAFAHSFLWPAKIGIYILMKELVIVVQLHEFDLKVELCEQKRNSIHLTGVSAMVWVDSLVWVHSHWQSYISYSWVSGDPRA